MRTCRQHLESWRSRLTEGAAVFSRQTPMMAQPNTLLSISQLPEEHVEWAQTTEGLWIPAQFIVPASGGCATHKLAISPYCTHLGKLCAWSLPQAQPLPAPNQRTGVLPPTGRAYGGQRARQRAQLLLIGISVHSLPAIPVPHPFDTGCQPLSYSGNPGVKCCF
jgi:hypothetical protein